MLPSPPTPVAEPRGGIDVYAINLSAAQNLPEFERQYRRHTGVLDTLPQTIPAQLSPASLSDQERARLLALILA